MTDAEIQEFVTRFAAAWAARDGKAFLDLWHPEGSCIRRWWAGGWRATSSTG